MINATTGKNDFILERPTEVNCSGPAETLSNFGSAPRIDRFDDQGSVVLFRSASVFRLGLELGVLRHGAGDIPGGTHQLLKIDLQPRPRVPEGDLRGGVAFTIPEPELG